MSKKLPRCRFCGQPFRADRCNASRQKYCKRPECVTERKRIRQRRWYNSRRRTDDEFRESENARCKEANRRRRQVCRKAAPAASAPDSTFVSEVLTGLVSHLTDTSDTQQLRNSMQFYASRGRRMAVSAPTGTDPP